MIEARSVQYCFPTLDRVEGKSERSSNRKSSKKGVFSSNSSIYIIIIGHIHIQTHSKNECLPRVRLVIISEFNWSVAANRTTFCACFFASSSCCNSASIRALLAASTDSTISTLSNCMAVPVADGNCCPFTTSRIDWNKY